MTGLTYALEKALINLAEAVTERVSRETERTVMTVDDVVKLSYDVGVVSYEQRAMIVAALLSNPNTVIVRKNGETFR